MTVYISTTIKINCHFKYSELQYYTFLFRGWGSPVSVVTRLWNGWPGFDSQQGWWFFSFPLHYDWLWGPPASYSMSTGDSFSWDKAGNVWSWPFTSI